MLKRTRCSLVVASSLAVALASAAQDAKDAPVPAARIGELSWLAGRWQGELFGGPLDEHWSGGEGGVMLGMCRIDPGHAKSTYELMMIEPKDGNLVMKLRHFDAGLTHREDKALEYAMVRLDARSVSFVNDKDDVRRIEYVLKSPSELRIRLHFQEGEAPSKPVEGTLKRLP